MGPESRFCTTGQGHVLVCQRQHLTEHPLNAVGGAVLVRALVQGASDVRFVFCPAVRIYDRTVYLESMVAHLVQGVSGVEELVDVPGLGLLERQSHPSCSQKSDFRGENRPKIDLK